MPSGGRSVLVLVAQQMPLRADWGMQGSCPACCMCVPHAVPEAIAFPAACTASYSNGVFGQGVQVPKGSRKPPGATPPGGTREGGSQRGQTRGQRRTRETPAKRGGCGYSLFGICTTRSPNRRACCIQLAVPRPPGNANRIASGSASIAALHISAFRRGPAALPYFLQSAANTWHFVPVPQHQLLT